MSRRKLPGLLRAFANPFRRRPRKRPRTDDTVLMVEGLEERCVLAGNITLSVVGMSTQNEGDAPATTTYTFQVDREDATGNLDVTWTVTGTGSDVADADDFVGGSYPTNTVSFSNNGTTSEQFTVDVSGDSTLEADEQFLVTITEASDPGNNHTIDGTADTQTATISNDDTLTAIITANDATAAEPADDGQFTVSFQGGGSTEIPVTVDYLIGTEVGAATNGTDYAILSGSVVVTGTSATIDVDVTDDSDVEGDETVTLTLDGTDNGDVGFDTTSAVVTIADDDAEFYIDQTMLPSDANEGDTSNTTYDFIVKRDGNTTGNVDVTYQVTSTDATVDTDDITNLGVNQTVTILDGNDSATITVTVNGDLTLEPDEDFTVTITDAAGASNRIDSARDSGSAAILNEDTLYVRVRATDATAREPADDGEFTIDLLDEDGNAGDSEIDVTVDFSVGGTASPGNASPDDYQTISPTSVSFSADTTLSDTVLVDVIDNSVFETDETVTLTATTTSSTDVAVDSGVQQITDTVTISDDDAPDILIEGVADGVENSGGTPTDGQFRVYLSSGTAPSDITVDYEVVTGSSTAEEGTDFATLSGSVIISSGASEAFFDIDVTEDLLFEGTEIVTVRITSVSLGNNINDQDTINIFDDETVQFEFVEATSSVDPEDDNPTVTNHTVDVVLVADPGVTLDVDVDVTVTDLTGSGTATEGDDYDAIGGSNIQTLTFVSGSGNGVMESISIDVNGDKDVEGNETIALEITGTSEANATPGTQDTHTVTIVDDDQIFVRFALTGSETGSFETESFVTESDTTQTHSVTLELEDFKSGNAQYSGTFDVEITATDITGSLGADYDTPTSTATFTVAFPNNGSENSTVDIDLDIIGDLLLEGVEQFQLAITGVSGTTGISIDTSQDIHVVNIDDDESVEVQFVNTISSAPEGTTPHTVSVELVGNKAGIELAQEVTADISDTPNTATAGALNDYLSVSETVTFAVGYMVGVSADETVSITINNDAILEGDEDFDLTIDSVTGPTNSDMSSLATTGTNASHTVTIQDNETFVVNFQSATTTVTEPTGGSTNVTPTLVLTVLVDGSTPGGTVESGFEPTATVTTSTDGSGDFPDATAGSDYTSFSPIDVTFDSGTTKSFTIEILPDVELEGTEDIDMTITAVSDGGSPGTDKTHEVQIEDNEAFTVVFDTATSSRAEDSGTGAVDSISQFLAVVVFEDGTSTEGTSVSSGFSGSVTLEDRTATVSDADDATSGSDYSAFGTPVLSISGSTISNQGLTILNDNLLEGDEIVEIGIASVSGTGAQNPPSDRDSHEVTIEDNESGTVQFSSGSSSVSEANDASVGLELVVSGDLLDTVTYPLGLERDLVVTVNSTDDTAVNGEDFNFTDGTGVTFSAATGTSIPGTLSVDIINDPDLEDDETFDLDLDSVASSFTNDVTISGITTHTVTILDNETATVQYSTASQSVSENGGPSVPVQVNLTIVPDASAEAGTPELQLDVTANLTAGGTALSPGDYTGMPGSVMFTGGSTSESFNLNIVDDDDFEGTQSISLGFGSISDSAVSASGNTTQTISISDDESATVEFTSASTAASEDDAVAGLNFSPGIARYFISADVRIISGDGGGGAFETSVSATIGASSALAIAYPNSLGDYAFFDTSQTYASSAAYNNPIFTEPQSVEFFVLNDLRLEGDEVVTLSLNGLSSSGTTNLGASSQSTHQVAIEDNEFGFIQFPSSASLVAEDAGVHTVPVNLIVDSFDSSGTDFWGVGLGLERTFNVSVNAVDGSAVSPDDYSASGNVFIPAAPTSGVSSNTVNITLVDDPFDEGNESFVLNLASFTGQTSSVQSLVSFGGAIREGFTSHTVTISSPGDVVPVPDPISFDPINFEEFTIPSSEGNFVANIRPEQDILLETTATESVGGGETEIEVKEIRIYLLEDDREILIEVIPVNNVEAILASQRLQQLEPGLYRIDFVQGDFTYTIYEGWLPLTGKGISDVQRRLRDAGSTPDPLRGQREALPDETTAPQTLPPAPSGMEAPMTSVDEVDSVFEQWAENGNMRTGWTSPANHTPEHLVPEGFDAAHLGAASFSPLGIGLAIGWLVSERGRTSNWEEEVDHLMEHYNRD